MGNITSLTSNSPAAYAPRSQTVAPQSRPVASQSNGQLAAADQVRLSGARVETAPSLKDFKNVSANENGWNVERSSHLDPTNQSKFTSKTSTGPNGQSAHETRLEEKDGTVHTHSKHVNAEGSKTQTDINGPKQKMHYEGWTKSDGTSGSKSSDVSVDENGTHSKDVVFENGQQKSRKEVSQKGGLVKSSETVYDDADHLTSTEKLINNGKLEKQTLIVRELDEKGKPTSSRTDQDFVEGRTSQTEISEGRYYNKTSDSSGERSRLQTTVGNQTTTLDTDLSGGRKSTEQSRSIDGKVVHNFKQVEQDGKLDTAVRSSANGLDSESRSLEKDGKTLSGSHSISFTDAQQNRSAITSKVDNERGTNHLEARKEFANGDLSQVSYRGKQGVSPDNHSTVDTLQKLGSNTYQSSNSTTRESDGTLKLSSVETINGETVRSSDSVTSNVKANLDVAGLDLFGSHNPQDLMSEKMGQAADIRSTRKRENWTEGKSQGTSIETKWSNPVKETQLVENKSEGGPSAWTYTNANGDSQMFFQGSRDTVLTHNSEKNGWKTQEVSSQLSSQEAAKNNEIPSQSEATVRSKEKASSAELLDGSIGHRFDQPFVDFARENATQSLKINSFKETGSYANGQPHGAENLVAHSESGRSLAYYRDAKTGQEATVQVGPDGTRAYSQKGADGKWTSSQASLGKDAQQLQQRLDILASKPAQEQMAQLTAGEAAHEHHYASETAAHLAHPAAGAAAGANIGLKALEKLRVGAKAGEAAQGLGHAAHAASLADRFEIGAVAVDGFLTVANASTMVMASADGDTHKALHAGSHMGQDLGKMIVGTQKLAEHGLATAVKPWASVVGKGLGFAGAGLELGTAVQEASHGHYASASFSAASAVGSGMILAESLGAASWLGPAGWAVAGAAAGGKMAWNYNESTKIADFQL